MAKPSFLPHTIKRFPIIDVNHLPLEAPPQSFPHPSLPQRTYMRWYALRQTVNTLYKMGIRKERMKKEKRRLVLEAWEELGSRKGLNHGLNHNYRQMMRIGCWSLLARSQRVAQVRYVRFSFCSSALSLISSTRTASRAWDHLQAYLKIIMWLYNLQTRP